MTTAGSSALDDIAPSGPISPSLRHALREATQPAHTRLHGHPALGAVQAGTIDPASYRALLARLYGFHTAFETALGIAPERSLWLAADLQTLGMAERAVAALPRCPYLPRFNTPHRKLGAHYVVEGSTLGGRELSKRLDHLFGPNEKRGRSFFSGRDGDTGKTWRAFIDQLDKAGGDRVARTEIVASAISTFAAFEDWLLDWKVAAHAGH